MNKMNIDHNFENHIKKNDLKLLIELYMIYKHTLWKNEKVVSKDENKIKK